MRWTPLVKQRVLREAEEGVDVLAMYGLSEDELQEWRSGYLEHGLVGLKVTLR